MQKWKLTVVREPSAVGFPDAPALLSSAEVYGRFRTYCEGLDREEFIVLPLDNKHKPIGFHVAAIGSLTGTICHPREIAKIIILANAARWICLHNHPSGVSAPSSEDVEITRRLRDMGELLGIPLLDHIIIGIGCFTSMKDDGYW